MSMWKPILNQAHFDRMHKTKPHQEKGEQHEGSILKNGSQKHNQLLKNNWPPIKDKDCYEHLRPSSLYKQKALTFIYTHTYISEFNT